MEAVPKDQGEHNVSGSDLGDSKDTSSVVFHEAHFVPLREQSNVYGLLSLHMFDGLNKLVVATFRGQIYCLEFHKPSIQRPPSFQPISFTYIPGMYEMTVNIKIFCYS